MSATPDDLDTGRMPLLEHLRELRNRVVVMMIALAVGTLVAMAAAPTLIDATVAPVRAVFQTDGPVTEMDVLYAQLTAPLQAVPGWSMVTGGEAAQGKLTLHGSLEGIYTYLRVGFMGGVVLALPVLAHQVWGFVAPGLYRTERRWVWPLAAASTFLFLLGAGFAYIVILPVAFRFFVTVVEAEALLSLGDVMKTVIRIVLAFGLCYQLPVAVWFLARLGLVDARDLVGGFRYAIVGIFVIAALVTPPDVITQFLLGIPLILLYAASIVVAWFATTKVRSAAGDDDEPTDFAAPSS